MIMRSNCERGKCYKDEIVRTPNGGRSKLVTTRRIGVINVLTVKYFSLPHLIIDRITSRAVGNICWQVAPHGTPACTGDLHLRRDTTCPGMHRLRHTDKVAPRLWQVAQTAPRTAHER